ncbi:histidine phosphatase superfamily [Neohortaea acidophila]|uniref:Histidine phosphatase superfamily n=1 Tax=Neohortaea acidophila TaxID=245834 RepID=A0A6A6PLJ1_9PEZI|nr:histidine phosphatase superfamily [Neohortaea acidophila]KAF2480805.1 histidine phosphatase superfamily [Neohortaea acidophila]
MFYLTSAALLVGGAFAQVPSALYGTFYPKNINTTEWISNDTIGTYGGIYQAGTYDWNVENKTYGTYDYCFMPHPRVQEYRLPAPVANGSVKAELVYLQYLQRHQRRTPYNILPTGENQPFECDNIDTYLYAGPGQGVSAQAPIDVYGETYTDPTNPFVKTYIPGTCQYPQLTIGGLLDAYIHAQDLWGVYGEKLGFLPSCPDNTTWFRSSESPLTQQTAGGVLRGIWPSYSKSLPLHQQATDVDTVNEGFSCSYRNTILADILNTSAWQAQLQAAAPLLAQLEPFTANDSAWTQTFDHLSDNFQSRLCNGYHLPCAINDTSDCVSMTQADEVFRTGDWEWNYYWRAYPNAKTYIQTVEGLFIQEILARFAAVEAGTNTIKYEHDFIHDGDIGPVAGALGISSLRWPGMGSNIAFELWRIDGGSIYARVLYSGQPMETIYGLLEWLPLSQLVGILQEYVPENIIQLCNTSS